MKARLTGTRKKRINEGSYDLGDSTSFAKHGGHGHVWLPVELVLIDIVTADRSSRINSEVYSVIFTISNMLTCSQMLHN